MTDHPPPFEFPLGGSEFLGECLLVGEGEAVLGGHHFVGRPSSRSGGDSPRVLDPGIRSNQVRPGFVVKSWVQFSQEGFE